MMPFNDSFDGIWKTVIRPTVEQSGDVCKRADDMFAVGNIVDDIIASIKSADYLIADLTDQNPNVYYELGLAHAQGKSVILLTRDISEIPFDLRSQR